MLNVPPLGERHRATTYDVSLDGRSVYFEHQTDQNPPREVGVVLGWRNVPQLGRSYHAARS
jgi:hypothetical protein